MMLHTKYQGSRPCGFRQEDLFMFLPILDNVKHVTPGAGSFCFCLFCCFTSQVNSYGHGGTVSSPNHTYFLGKLEQAVNQYLVHILSLVTDNNPS